MSLRRTLSRLEAQAGSNTSDLLIHLSRFLATVDARSWPARYTSVSNYHAIMAAQKDYFEHGASYTLEGSDQSTWKASERVRTALCNEGWAVPCESGKIRLSLLGDCVARHAVGLPTITNEITVHFFEKLAELPAERNGNWISEATLFSLEDCDYPGLHTITEFVQPLIVHRAIESVSSTIARCFYRRLQDTLPKVTYPVIEQNGVCLDEYSETFCRSIQQRKNAVYDGTEIYTPLSASR